MLWRLAKTRKEEFPACFFRWRKILVSSRTQLPRKDDLTDQVATLKQSIQQLTAELSEVKESYSVLKQPLSENLDQKLVGGAFGRLELIR